MRVLIVDDSAVMRRIVRRTLRQAGLGGHEFDEAENGREALEMIAKESYEVILSEWNTPEMTGIELLEALNEAGKAIPFCFVTSEATAAMKQRARDAGAQAFVTKPFTDQSMAAALGALLG